MALSHLEFLHDELETPEGDSLHYWWIYATPDEPFERRPPPDAEFTTYHASNEGITCVDDVARIAVVYLSHYGVHGDDHSRERARQALEFVQYMQCDDGRFLNFVTDPDLNETVFDETDPDVVEGVRVNGSPTSEPGIEFWASRACWALGEGYRTFADEDPEFAASLADSLRSYLDVVEEQALSAYGEYEQARGERVPSWLVEGDSYVTAPVVLGLGAYCRAADDDRAAKALRKLADGLADCQDGDAVAYPFGTHLSVSRGDSWHTWGLRQVAALARAGDVLDEDEYVASARREVAGLYTLSLTSAVQFARFGPSPVPYHQLSYGTDALVHGCTELWRATGESSFAHLGEQVASWYHGNNIERTRMWDPDAGRGFDGIYEDTTDWRAGAESTLAAARTMLDLERYPGSARFSPELTVHDGPTFGILDAENGELGTGATRVTAPNQNAVFSGGQVVSVFDGGTLTLSPDLEPGEYRPYLVAKRLLGPDSTAVLSVGDQRRTQSVGGQSGSYYWMEPFEPVELPAGAAVELTFHGPLDREGTFDALVFQPAVARRAVEAADGERAIGLARSFVDEQRTATFSIPALDGTTVATQVCDERGRIAGESADAETRGPELAVPVEPRGYTLFRTSEPAGDRR